jgi:Transposase DDE domain/Domain of unknown function (DUF4372)
MSYQGPFVLSQVFAVVHRQQFHRCVSRHRGDYKVRQFTCRAQFICLVFAQLTQRESLRDIEACLNAVPSRWPQLGLPGAVARTTLAEANEARDWRIYADLAEHLIRRARKLYASETLGEDIDQTVYALDSTTIDLCLALFPWARYRRADAAIKLHTLLDVRGPIPTFVHITDGKCADVHALDEIVLEPGSFYVMDRGYLDLARLYLFVVIGAFFVTRAKRGMRFSRIQSRPVDRTTGLRCDQTVWIATTEGARKYPDKIRRVGFRDPETGKVFVFLTNNFDLPALTIARLYKLRWRVELFFKWIKGHLRIKSFLGTSRNAVQTQVWSALCTYLMVAILKKQLDLPQSLHTILQILSTHAFSQVPLSELLNEVALPEKSSDSDNQLTFNW